MMESRSLSYSKWRQDGGRLNQLHMYTHKLHKSTKSTNVQNLITGYISIDKAQNWTDFYADSILKKWKNTVLDQRFYSRMQNINYIFYYLLVLWFVGTHGCLLSILNINLFLCSV